MLFIKAWSISIPLSQLMLFGCSLIWKASLTLREYQWESLSRNLIFSLSGGMAGLVGMFRNSKCFITGQTDVSFVFFNSFLYRPSCFADVNAITVVTGDHIHNPVLFVLGNRRGFSLVFTKSLRGYPNQTTPHENTNKEPITERVGQLIKRPLHQPITALPTEREVYLIFYWFPQWIITLILLTILIIMIIEK